MGGEGEGEGEARTEWFVKGKGGGWEGVSGERAGKKLGQSVWGQAGGVNHGHSNEGTINSMN